MTVLSMKSLGSTLARAAALGAACVSWAAAQTEPPHYVILPGASVLQVHTYKGGLLSGFGHEHDIRAQAYAGAVDYDPANPAAARVSLTVRAESLQVVLASDSADVPAITAAMREHVLRVDSFPEIRFTSTAVERRDSVMRVSGDLTLAGRTRPIVLDLDVRLADGVLHAAGTCILKQTDSGIRPYTAALGTVRVKDEVMITIDIRAVAAPPEPEPR